MTARIPLLFVSLFLFLSSSAQHPDSILLKNYRPVSIYKIPQSNIKKAAYPVIDMHSHDHKQIGAAEWIKTMDSAGIQKSIILTYTTGKALDSVIDKYKAYPDRFEIWCGFDYTGFGQPGWSERAVKELVRGHQKGVKGVGELGDKGEGELYSDPVPGKGIHIDNPALQPLLRKCAELNMPISIHVAEDQWMYENPDSTNDGLLNAAKWHVNMNVPGKLGHDELQATLERAAANNPKTTFIACHFANSCSDLNKLGAMFDRHPNLYADIAARFGEVAPIPRTTAAFFTKYQDRLVYGTDMGLDSDTYQITFRILESNDEHFYAFDHFGYHWALNGLNLPKKILQKVYHDNAAKILNRK